MKNIILIGLLLLSIILTAIPQSMEDARTAADSFLMQRGKNVLLEDAYSISERGENIYYVFNLEPDGFVAVSADDDLVPIIAYSFHQTLENEDLEENYLHQMLKTDLNMRSEYYRQNPDDALENQQKWQSLLNGEQRDNLRFQQWPAPGTTITDGWIDKQWNQSGVYNQMCPLDNSGGRSVVGCVATAMSMIMDYHEYIGNPVFTDADDYASGYYNPIYIDDEWEEHDFPAFPDLNNYLQDIAAHYAAGIILTADDKAALNFAAGVSVEMSYSSTGSGTWTSLVPDALLNKFGYDSAEYVENEGSWFYDILIDNMQSMQPTELTIYQAGFEGGHAINCDGYNTDDYYHLNFGWGTSNNTCWYTLPAGMPSGYCILTGAAVNIEGGEVPVAVQGDVDVDGCSPEGTYITFDGPRFYECFVENADGSFDVPAMTAGTYNVTAILQQRAYYQCQEDVVIDENNDFIQIDLGEFAYFTGHVNAPISAENAAISFYKNDELVYSGTADSNGDYSIPEVLPGTYQVTASLGSNYFSSKEVVVSLDDQTEDFDLAEYPGNMAVSFAGADAEIWNLIPNYTLSCGIKLTNEELSDLGNDVISGIRFKSPINSDEGELYAQVWLENILVSEMEIQDFNSGEWLDVDLESFVPVNPDQDVLVGYKITSPTGAIAYRDNGPRITGKGAFFNNGNWVELAANNDFNFCIEAKIITQEYGSVTGLVVLDGGSGEISDAIIKAGKYTTHPGTNGVYWIDLKAGIYDLSAQLNHYLSDSILGLEVIENSVHSNNIFNLVYNVGTNENTLISTTKLIGNYPNPFNPSTTISFSVTQTSSFVNLSVFNIKGQKVKTLADKVFPAGEHALVWNGKDQNDKPVSSGIYYYQLKAGNKTYTNKMLLMK
ncbi:MAG: C10 family peptidase [Candidatus Cloacimonetes bacterium]|nr:C10 family peptidase [Candidatus Cloacimonadota bacterium]MCF7814809.1 C10 family peptidase [Candidatus Cloacimonadota bacterium]MCF7869196.1 C10 family peptidase [Candidatus Cloacimonadota bacterium]MCF7884623.1 C10 family peptidase [Candidatus Cloacimonadota bacterium]